MDWFKNNKPKKSAIQNPNELLPSLRILGIDWSDVDEKLKKGDAPPVNLIGYTLKKEEKGVVACMIPSLTKEGRFSFVFGSKDLDDFKVIQKDISSRFATRINDPKLWRQLSSIGLTNFMVVGFTLAFPEEPQRMFLVYETLISPTPIPELYDIYSRLKSVASSTDTKEIELYYEDSIRKKWLNDFIDGLEKMLNWPDFVTKSMRQINRNKES
jgi:hypothetical protein